MANFTTLEKTVNFYDKVMNGFRIYTEQLNINYTTIRYEDLLNDFQGTATDILRFLDLDWQEELHDYRETAMRRGYISTPSASQVIQPIYKSSMRRWENYRSHFQEHMSKLDQWIKYWQYSQ
jgi:hypothetical protein